MQLPTIIKNRGIKLRSRLIEIMISELTNQNQIENRWTPQGLDSFRRTLSISPEQEEVLRSPVHEKCNYISPQFTETDLGATEINEKRQIGKCSSEGTLTSFVKIEEILPKVLRVKADLSALKEYAFVSAPKRV